MKHTLAGNRLDEFDDQLFRLNLDMQNMSVDEHPIVDWLLSLGNRLFAQSAEMGALQCRQRPRNRSQLTIGMLSRTSISWWQERQRDLGLTIDSPSGTRAMTTFRKDPMMRPSTALRPIAIPSTRGKYRLA